MEQITSVNNNQIKYYNSLHQKKTRDIENLYLVEGAHLVKEAFKLNLLDTIISSSENELNKYNGIKHIYVTDAIINKLSTTQTPQNIIGVVRKEEKDFQICDKMIILDGVSDPGNVGTIIRTSLALGVKTIILSSEAVDLYNEKLLRATQGAFFQANLYQMDLVKLYELLKENNIPLIATSLKANTNINELPKLSKYALCMGNEANGISKVTEENATYSVIIPLQNNIESLNVATSHAIILYQLEGSK